MMVLGQSLMSHLTSEASVHRENAATYSAGNKDQKGFVILFQRSSSAPSLGLGSAIFPANNTLAHCAYASSARFALVLETS